MRLPCAFAKSRVLQIWFMTARLLEQRENRVLGFSLENDCPSEDVCSERTARETRCSSSTTVEPRRLRASLRLCGCRRSHKNSAVSFHDSACTFAPFLASCRSQVVRLRKGTRPPLKSRTTPFETRPSRFPGHLCGGALQRVATSPKHPSHRARSPMVALDVEGDGHIGRCEEDVSGDKATDETARLDSTDPAGESCEDS